MFLFFKKKIRIIEREVAILCNLIVKVTFTLLPILFFGRKLQGPLVPTLIGKRLRGV